MRKVIALIAAAALAIDCDDKRVLREPATVTGHDVTVNVTDLADGRLAIEVRNGRAERISEPRAQLSLYLVDGVPTLDLGPSELYARRKCYPSACSETVAGVEPGGVWSVEAEVPRDQSRGHKYHQQDKQIRGAPARFNSLRLRVWIFPHRGVVDSCKGRLQVLPDLIVDASPGELRSRSFWAAPFLRAFTSTAERGVFHEAPPTPDQSTLYFIETDLELKRPFEVNLLPGAASAPSTANLLPGGY